VDLIGACRAFVSVSDRGSVTLGAAAARIPQSVASRRILALESHLGRQLLDRSSRRALLTPFGRTLLPSARRLVAVAAAFESDAEQARGLPVRIALPESCSVLDVAQLIRAARTADIVLDAHTVPPAERARNIAAREGWAAVIAVPSPEAHWTVPLGVASSGRPAASSRYIDSLRESSRDASALRTRLWIESEDDVPQIRDRLTRLGDSLGLAPSQVATAPLASAVAEVLGSADLLLCSRRQADELDLYWTPIGELDLTRGYALRAETSDDAARLREAVGADIARCLGAAE
jgi:DNA-binding transcriptional LysR family regulator